MKNLLPTAVVLMFALGNCTEEVIVVKKEIVHDTVPKFVDRVFAGTDSTKIPIIVDKPAPSRENKDSIIIQKDTVWAVRVDTLWRVETRTIYDTTREVVYQWGDTLILWYARDRFSIDPAVMPIFNQFFADASAHGLTPQGGKVIVEIVPLDEVLQSQAFNFNSQQVIMINDNLTPDERWLPLMRELARWQLGKEYSQTVGDYMYPFMNANTIRMSSTKAEKEKFWTEIMLPN